MTPSVKLKVYVQPRASRTEIAGYHGAELKIRVKSAPLEDAANEELVAFIAAQLGTARRNVRIVAGAHGRRKTLELTDVRAAAVAALGAPPASG